jgi:DNA-binding NarL/FixJ family response regulator
MDSETSLLIADELGLVRDGIAQICQTAGWTRQIFTCGDGREATALVEERQPTVALIDFQLPGGFSLDLVRHLRDRGTVSRLVIMAARGDRKLALEALRAGANGFVLKTCLGGELIDALNRVLSGSLYVTPVLQFEKVFRANGRDTSTRDPVDQLSTREYQVFQLLVEGVRAKDIAARLNLSPKTVDTYRSSLMRKLDIYDVAGLVKFAIQRDLITA